MVDFQKRTGLIAVLGAVVLAGVLIFVLLPDLRHDIMRLFGGHVLPPSPTITIYVELPGCSDGSGKPFSEVGFYVGSGSVQAGSGTCGPPSGTGLRTIPAGDLSQAFCVGSFCSASPGGNIDESYAEAREIIALSERVNQIIQGKALPGPTISYKTGPMQTITITFSSSSRLLAAQGILCSQTNQSTLCQKPIPTNFTICMVSDKQCLKDNMSNSTGILPKLYAYADAVLALSESQ